MTIALVQSASGNANHADPLGLTLGAVPTVGNTLIYILTQNAADCTFSPNNGTWTHIAGVLGRPIPVEWPMRFYLQHVTGALSATTTASKSGGGGAIKGALLELTGLLTYLNQVSVVQTTGQVCTANITPTAGRNAALLSVCMNGWTQPLTPAVGMTQIGEVLGSNNLPVEFNYRLVTAASGSYSVGSSGNDTGSGMLGISLLEPAPAGRTSALVI